MSPRTEPVTMYRPRVGCASTASFTACNDEGTSCHSSISTGSARPSSTEEGELRNAFATAGSANRSTVAARCSQDVVLPAARGPTTSTAE